MILSANKFKHIELAPYTHIPHGIKRCILSKYLSNFVYQNICLIKIKLIEVFEF